MKETTEEFEENTTKSKEFSELNKFLVNMEENSVDIQENLEKEEKIVENLEPQPTSTLPFIPTLKYPVDPQPQVPPSPLEAPSFEKRPEEELPQEENPWAPKLRNNPIFMEDKPEDSEFLREESDDFSEFQNENTTASHPSSETLIEPEVPSNIPKKEESETEIFSDDSLYEDPLASLERLIKTEKVPKKKKESLDEDIEKFQNFPLKKSLINLKEPSISVELPKKQQEEKPPDFAFQEAIKEKKQRRPLIQLSTPNLEVKKDNITKSTIDTSIYEEAFDIDHLPIVDVSPPNDDFPDSSTEEPAEESAISPDDPLYDFIESLRDPLPTERFTPEFRNKMGSGDFQNITEENEFSRLLDNIAETSHVKKSVTSKEVGNNGKLPSNHPRAKVANQKKSPIEYFDSVVDLFKIPSEKLTNDQKQYRMVGIMLLFSCVLGFFAMLPQLLTTVSTPSAVSTVQLDVNPSILIEVTSKNTVSKVTPVNKEALLVVGSMEYEGLTLEKTIDLLVESLVIQGFIQESTTILATVEDSKQTRGESLSITVKEYLDIAISSENMTATSVGQWVNPSFDYRASATNEGVSLGKYIFMKEMNEISNFFSIEKLKELTQQELYQTYVLGSVSLPIGIESAVELARQSVLLSDLDSYVTKVYTNLLEETPHYHVMFQTPTKEFHVEVEGFFGNILKSDEYSAYNLNPTDAILPITAKNNALDYVNILEIQTSQMSVVQDWSKSRLQYLVSFSEKDVRHTLTVLGFTGEILDHVETIVKEESIKDMGQSAIQNLVLEDAGVTKAQLGSYEMTQDVFGNILVYDFNFWVGNRQYIYKIEGDGTIISSEAKDFGEQLVTENSTGLISETKAKDEALTHAGVSFSQTKGLTVKLNSEGNYIVTFYAENDTFYYVVSGTTGSILAYEKEDESVEDVEEVANVEEPEVHDIGEEGAKQIAISASSLKEVMIQTIDISANGSGMEKNYDVQFVFLGVEYYYRISAETGDILDSDVIYPKVENNTSTQNPTTQEPSTNSSSTTEEWLTFDGFDDIFDEFNEKFNAATQFD